MEIIDEKKPKCCGAAIWKRQNVYVGVVLILVGLLWIVNNFNLCCDSFFDVIFSWQMLIVVIGGYFLSLRSWVAGTVVILIGLCFVVTDFLHVDLHLGKLIFPLLFIAGGIGLLIACKK